MNGWRKSIIERRGNIEGRFEKKLFDKEKLFDKGLIKTYFFDEIKFL